MILLYVIFLGYFTKNFDVENLLKDVEKSSFSVENCVENVKNNVNKGLNDMNFTISGKK